ncbi:MAG: peptide ABC transporter substrate-binding protein [Clostridia bacterium]|nr:peptide ABC transporter substrate-binding protein [Clostridia bacterium]
MKKRLLALLAAVCLLCSGLCGCSDDGTGRGFRFPLEREPAELDPQMATDTASVTVIAALFEGLTRLDANGIVTDGAATHTLSEDERTYTFTLRESYWSTIRVRGQKTPFDEPTPVTADDFLFAFQRAVDPATGSPLAAEFDIIQNAAAIRMGEKPLSELGVSAPDQRTLVITLEKPDASFLERLSGTPFAPCNRAFFEYTGGRYGLEEEYVLSNGAFRLAAWNHDESLLLYKHEAYHQVDDVSPEAVRFVIGAADTVEALKTGSLDAAPLTVAERTALGDNVACGLLWDSLRGLWFNTGSDPFTVAPLRQALRDSIDWSAVTTYVETTAGEWMAKSYVPPDATVAGEGTYHPEGLIAPVLSFPTDVTAAKAAMNEGLQLLYPDGQTGRLRFELIAPDDTVSADLARYLVQSWQKNLNVYPTLTLLPEAEVEKRVKNGQYQAALYTYSPAGLTGAENLSCFATDATDNPSRLKDDSVDAAIQKALTGGRAELEVLDKTLWRVCPCVPLSYPTRYYGVRNDVKIEGVTILPFGGGRYHSPYDFRYAIKLD